MLIQCPECKLQVSDKAISCPHCGYPLKPSLRPYNSAKRKRLPNGFGQISRVKGNLRSPYRAMVTVGKTPEGHPICKLLQPRAYFPTYNDAYTALLEYNRDPYAMESKTLAELYTMWSDDFFVDLSESAISKYKQCWRYCSDIQHMRVRDIRVRHVRSIMDKSDSAQTVKYIKTMFNLMLDKAVEYEMTDKNYARMFNLDKSITKAVSTTVKKHIPFEDWEIQRIEENINALPAAKLILIQCYSGWRPRELITLKREDVNINDWTFTGGMKSDAGKNRVVPIHSKIRDWVKEYYDHGEEYLFGKMTYNRLLQQFNDVVYYLELKNEHRPHDGRAHFITACKNAGVDEYAIKYMVGHAIRDITEDVYTTRSVEWLREEIEKIK